MTESWTDSERVQELDHAVGVKVQTGCRVESRTPFQAVLVSGRPINHLLHFLVGLITVGIWWIVVWLPMAVIGSGETRIVLSVDQQGRVSELTSRDKLPARPAIEVRDAQGNLL